MTQIYVKEQGAMVRRSGDRLVVSKQGQILDEFPFAKVEQLVLMGNVQLTAQATASLLQKQIDVVFLSSYGKFRGRLEGDTSRHTVLRHKQLQMMGNEGLTLPLAQAVVDAKINNQRVVLLRQAQRLDEMAGSHKVFREQAAFDQALKGMMAMKQGATTATNHDGLRGFEGKAAVFYFAALRSFLDPAWQFTKREYYPPPNPFNALLSFVYSLVLKDVQAAVNTVGLDQYLGFFHEVSYGRPSLALDLMEEWRPLLADSLCLELVNRGVLTPNSFTWTNNPNRPVVLGDGSMEEVLRAYGSRLETKLHHALAGPGGQTTLQKAMVLQVRQLSHVIDGRDKVYEPVRAK